MSDHKPKLFIALDGLKDHEQETLMVAKKLARVDGSFGFKFNLDYIMEEGMWGAVSMLQDFGLPLFADTKMWNGSRTMQSIVRDAVEREVDYINVHALAGPEIRKAAEVAKGSKTTLLGVTILSHYNDEYCGKYFGRSLEEMVTFLCSESIEYGCGGVILPGTMLQSVRDSDFLKMATGIRPSWFKDDRHEQTIEPYAAVKAGADILVCGSPITKSDDQVGALKRILEEMDVRYQERAH